MFSDVDRALDFSSLEHLNNTPSERYKREYVINQWILSNSLDANLLYSKFKSFDGQSDFTDIWSQLFNQHFQDLSKVERFDGRSFHQKIHRGGEESRYGGEPSSTCSAISNDSAGNLTLEMCRAENRVCCANNHRSISRNSRVMKGPKSTNFKSKLILNKPKPTIVNSHQDSKLVNGIDVLRRTLLTCNGSFIKKGIDGLPNRMKYEIEKKPGTALDIMGIDNLKENANFKQGLIATKKDESRTEIAKKVGGKMAALKSEIKIDKSRSEIFQMDSLDKLQTKPDNSTIRFLKSEAHPVKRHFSKEIVFARNIFDDDEVDSVATEKNSTPINSLLSMQLNGQVVCSFSKSLKVHPKPIADKKKKRRQDIGIQAHQSCHKKSNNNKHNKSHQRSDIAERPNHYRDYDEEIMVRYFKTHPQRPKLV